MKARECNLCIRILLPHTYTQLASQTNELITSTNASILNTSEHVRASTDLLTAAQAQADNNSQLLVSISSTVDSINSQLAIAMEAAASVSLSGRYTCMTLTPVKKNALMEIPL